MPIDLTREASGASWAKIISGSPLVLGRRSKSRSSTMRSRRRRRGLPKQPPARSAVLEEGLAVRHEELLTLRDASAVRQVHRLKRSEQG